jgi:hypothetical protein
LAAHLYKKKSKLQKKIAPKIKKCEEFFSKKEEKIEIFTFSFFSRNDN